MNVQDYGLFEADGVAGYQSARIALRAPRIAIRVDTAGNWQSKFALAIFMASRLWGGFGFIYLPRSTGDLHPALARILGAYDPDYLVDAVWTHGDMEAMNPGWHSRQAGWPADADDADRALTFLRDDIVVTGLDDDSGANLCSPFYERTGFRNARVLSLGAGNPALDLTAVVGTQRATFEVPAGLDAQLTLALGLRAGYPDKPLLPLGRAAGEGTERLSHRYVYYALSMWRAAAALGFQGMTTAWSLTQTGLLTIAEVGPLHPPVAVIGSTPEDFALAVALDRMYGTTMWVPEEWTQEPSLRWPMEQAYRDFLQAARSSASPPIVTSISLSEAEVRAAVQASWLGPAQAWNVDDNNSQPPPADSNSVGVMPAAQLNLEPVRYLACVGDYDLSFTSPTRADGRGNSELLLPIPPHTPGTEKLRGPQRPFWVVDVDVYPRRMPAGRNLGGQAILADDEPFRSTILRSGRNGVSFNPMKMSLVSSGETLQQSVTKPRLRMLGLRGWIEALVRQDQPDTKVQLSQAGRRAMILTRLWGSRSAVARDLLELNNFLREFKPNGKSDTEAYPEADGVRLTSAEGYLTFAAAIRTLPAMETKDVRGRVDHLVHINVLQRGLIMPCSECERRAFYRMELVSERNACPRCGGSAYTTDARRSKQGEPEWYYDLHGAVRELLEQNGDVPFLSGWVLAANARSFEDIAELDFCRSEDKPDEIDVAAVVDGRLVVGEAKCVATLGRDANKAIAKLIRVGDLLGTDEILLATTAPGPWKDTETQRLLREVRRHSWRFGQAPRLRVLTSLRDNPQTDLPAGA